MHPRQKLNTILAALRLYQRTHPSWIPEAITAIATDGDVPALQSVEIDALCKELAAGPVDLDADPLRGWAVTFTYRDDEHPGSDHVCMVRCREGEIREAVETWAAENLQHYRPALAAKIDILEHVDRFDADEAPDSQELNQQ